MSDILYKGCMIPARFPFIEAAFKYICETAELRMKDMGNTHCCMEPVGLRSLNHDAWHSMSSHIVSKAGEDRIVSLCDGCVLSLTDSVSESSGSTEIIDVVEFLYENLDRIRGKIVSPLDMRLAVFPGCHCEDMLHRKGKDAFAMMSEILSVIGVRPLRPKDDICCGSGAAAADDILSKEILKESVESFKATGGNGVVTVCPSCFMQFDMVARYTTYNLAELVAKAMGWTVDCSEFHRGKDL